jgi:Zn-dependent protease
MNEIKLGRLAGLEFSAVPSAIIGALVLWLALSGIAIGVLNLPLGEALIGAVAAAALQFLSETAHQFGHVQAARQTGYPMIGIRYWGVLSSSLYPADEPTLPAAIHIRRALGGPTASAAVTLVAAAILLAIQMAGVKGTVWWLALYFLLINLFEFTLGSFLPLGFTDGSTLLYWRGKA